MRKTLLIQFAILFQAALAFAIPDNFVSREVLTGTFAQAVNNNQTATTEVGEPSTTGYRTLWYSWTAPANGELTVTIAGGDTFVQTLTVWMGTTVNSLKPVVPQTVSSSASVTFPVVAGTVYAICTGSYYSSDYGNIQVNLNLGTGSTINNLIIIGLATTTNDYFASRIITSTQYGSFVVYNGGATTETLEPATGYKTMWWTYRAPANGRLTITTDGSWSYVFELSAWSGTTVQGLKQIIPNDVSSPPTVLTFPVIQGNDYQICAGDYYSGDSGGPVVLTFTLDPNSDLNSFNLTGGAVFTNDNFSSAYTLTGDSPAVVSYNTYATREALEPSATGYKTLWFKWTAPVAGLTQMTTSGSDSSFLKTLSVYTGTAINTLTFVTNAAAYSLPTVAFSAVAGQTYYLSLGDYYSGDSGGSLILAIFGQPGTLATGPNLTLEKAVHLKFQTQSGHTYRIQQSTDLKNWNSLTNVFTGNGAIQDIYVGGADTGNKVFRVSAQ